ncbi:DUF6670 family protein [Acinetobacter tjernbergiae]|uniref:Uncharacterized protein n=1 Tax=Acinetobacter tjernbergiae DSM 14971 = CIP 107465 TaxID=1120928 RepID=V2W638_9GAMM|nr:DUF6670 family protein [Acinetobacter tjernbergiae]ESK55469.1 hypothetical protein F990_01761 [Acinetobacter tjernbergiae DSM 14971 = CIP 107465]
MPLMSNNQLKQLNLNKSDALTFYPPKGLFKIVYQALILPNLPEPFHYLNFISLIGQPRIPICYNASAITTTAIDTATVLVTSGLSTVGHLKSYSAKEQCQLEQDRYQFLDVDQIQVDFPNYYFKRIDEELSCQLTVNIRADIENHSALHWGVGDYWYARCQCEGEITYKKQKYQIEAQGILKHARAIYFPFIAFHFFTYQVIQVSANLQIILSELRNQWNNIVFSRIEIQSNEQRSILYDHQVILDITRVYPKVQTPDGREMYLAREFMWQYQEKNQIIFQLKAQSRGDYKFGLGAGYVGSFHYELIWNNENHKGSGYCEYIDCRPLHWQEKNKSEQIMDQIPHFQPYLCKK